MLAVTLRKTEIIPSFADQLRTYIQQAYGEPDESYSDDCRSLDQLRESIVSPNLPPNALESLIQYYGQLSKKPTMHYHLAYERASVLFNIGAFYSQRGTDEDGSEQGLKRACNYFQLASGAFMCLQSVLKDELRDILPPLDMHTDTLNCIIDVMMAQAAETVWDSGVINGKIKDPLASRIASAISSLYQKALASVVDTQAGLMDVMIHWINHIKAKQSLYAAHAQIRKAKESQQKILHGEAESRLKVARSILLKCGSVDLKLIPKPLADQIQKLETQVQEMDRQASRDNEIIYVQLVPKAEDLSAIVPIPLSTLAEPIAFKTDQSQLARPLFADLVPFEIHQLGNEYLSKLETKVSQIIRDSKTWVASAQAALHATGCPGHVELAFALENGESTPVTLVHRVHEFVAVIGGIDQLQSQIDMLSLCGRRCDTLINEIVRTLDEEVYCDSAMKTQYKEQWVRTPSLILQQTIRDRINELKEKLHVASTSDALIATTFTAGFHKLRLLQNAGRNGLDSVLPVATGTVSSKDPLIMSVHALLLEYEENLKQVDHILSELDSLKREDNFVEQLKLKTVDSLKNKKETLFKDHLAQYQPIQNKLDLVGKVQEKQIQHLCNLGSDLKAQTGGTLQTNATQRVSVLNDLNSAFDLAQQVVSNIKEGHKFYSDLTTVLTELQRQANDFVRGRAQEKQDMLANLTMPLDSDPSLSLRDMSISTPRLPPRPTDDPIPQAAQITPPPTAAGVWKPDLPPRFVR